MKKLKISEELKVTGVYFLLYAVIAYLVGSVYTFLVIALMDSLRVPTNPIVFVVISVLAPLLILWFGTQISAFFVKKNFILKHREQVITFATICYAVVEGIEIVRNILITEINGAPIIRNHPYSIGFSVVSTIVFYFFTKKHLFKAKKK